MFQFVPDAATISEMFADASAPTFFLFAIAAFVNLMNTRLNGALEKLARLRKAKGTQAEAEIIAQRIAVLRKGIHTGLRGGLFAVLLLIDLFACTFLRLPQAFGAPLLFFIATSFLGVAIFRFAQEAKLALKESDTALG